MITNLIDFRNNLGFSQKEIAKILGITYSFYSKIETGERRPSYNFLNKFKKTFPNADIDEIFFARDSH